MKRLRGGAASGIDWSTTVGPVALGHPLLTASGTAGHGAELASYFDLSAIGAVVVKSLSAEPWAGNPAPRVHETPAGMINSVGLQGPGVARWLTDELPALERAGARVVASIWGHTVDDFAAAAAALAAAPDTVVAVEVNVSCPNLEDGKRMFAHSPDATRAVLAATAACGRPRWAKLSPNTFEIVDIAAAAREGGAAAVTLVNTLMGMVIDVETRRPLLGAGRGGVSGPAIHPIAVRAVFDCRAALPDLPIVGVGGVASGRDVVEMLMAGADAVEIGTATFADPRAIPRIARELAAWCHHHGITRVRDVIGAAHHRPPDDPAAATTTSRRETGTRHG